MNFQKSMLHILPFLVLCYTIFKNLCYTFFLFSFCVTQFPEIYVTHSSISRFVLHNFQKSMLHILPFFVLCYTISRNLCYTFFHFLFCVTQFPKIYVTHSSISCFVLHNLQNLCYTFFLFSFCVTQFPEIYVTHSSISRFVLHNLQRSMLHILPFLILYNTIFSLNCYIISTHHFI